LWIEYISASINNHPNIVGLVQDLLKLKFIDPDERVRTSAIKSIGVCIQTHCNLFSQELLLDIQERTKDKKNAPRFEAIAVLAKQFNFVMKYFVTNSSQDSEIDVDLYAWIPGCLMEVVYLDDPETTILLEKVLQEDLIPPLLDDKQRTMRLLQMLSHFNQKQRNAFIAIFDRQAKTIHGFNMLIDNLVKYNGGIMDKDEQQTTQTVKVLIEFLCGILD
jgi:HEAT repeat protein